MKRVFKRIAQVPMRAADAYATRMGRRWPGISADWNDRAYERVRSLSSTITYDGAKGKVDLVLRIPNEVCRYRADTFATKEPETLEWIEQYGGSGAFYDIGANVGLYSLYYAKIHSGPVYAFEPSALNLGLLASNISANGMTSRIVVVPNPLTERNEVAEFHLSMLEEGGAMSTFGQEYGHDGTALVARLAYQTSGMSLDFMMEAGLIPEVPALLKIDVDGIEHLILRGAEHTLCLPSLRSVLIEVNDAFAELSQEVSERLSEAGFALESRRHSDMFEGGAFATSFNQIWVRPA